MAERDQRWDIFKGFAVFLVVLGHLTDDNTVLETLIYTVHMPIFFIVSGTLPGTLLRKIRLKTI